MKKLILATAVAAACVASLAHAEEPVPDHALTYNIGAVNDYRFRGISQTRFDPAVQGGADYIYNPLGLYAGIWASNIKWIKDTVNASGTGNSGKGSVEMDLYAGKRGDIGAGFTYDVGGLYYYYPSNNYSAGSTSTLALKNANTFELYGQVGYGVGYFKVSQALTNAFGNNDSKNSRYYDLTISPELAGGVILTLHAGHQTIAGGGIDGTSNSKFSYSDWKVGISKTFEQLAGITAGIALVGTDAKDGAYSAPDGKNLGRSGVVVSVSKTF
jgi:uncharacterized protein (TIGR02001 family)